MKIRVWTVAGLLVAFALAPVVSSARDMHRIGPTPEPAALPQAASEAGSEAAGSWAEDPEAPLWRRKYKPIGFQSRFFAQ